jgi:hypothetical protein
LFSTVDAAQSAVPTIQSVRKKAVLIKVPPGFSSVSLQQRNNRDARAWRILATRKTLERGGLIRISLRHAVPRRSLSVFGTRVRSSKVANAGGRIVSFAADPALRASNGFSGVGGAGPGVVAMNRASTDATTAGSGSAAVAREVAESDIWRIDDDRLYFFNQLRGLQVFDIAEPDAPVLLGQLREPNRGEQMYLLGTDHVALLTRPSYFFSLTNRPFSLARKGAAAYDAGSGSVVIAEVADGAPREIVRVPYEGYLAESRLVGSILYLVSQVFDPAEGSRLRVTSVDLSDPAFPTQADSLELDGYAGTVTATDRFLFVASPTPDWRRSNIDIIDISDPDGSLVRRGRVSTAGRVADKFKMNLAGETLTVVSGVPRNWSGDWNDPANLPRTMVETFSLALPDEPAPLGSLELAVGESVYATRFSEGRLYIVTFLTIDPLWVIDLEDPSNPEVLGELKVPGFSTYIEPLGDRLVSIGRLDSQTAVSLFDVSDPTAPMLLSQIPLGEGHSHSEANWDEKAFSVIPGHGLILVPYSGYDSASGWASRIQLIDLERDSLTARGIVDQGFAARRTAVVGERILAISPSDLITVDFADRDHPVVTSDVEIAWRVDRVFLAGDYLVQVGGSAQWSRTAPPTLTITTPEDPDSTLNLVELEDVPVTGATVRHGKLYLAQQNSARWLPVYRLDGSVGGDAADPSPPLILSVYDLSALPEVTLLGRSEAEADPGYGYGAGQLEAVWPGDETLVWVREQWSSWWWYDPMPIRMPVRANGLPVLSASAGTVMVGSNAPQLAGGANAITLAPTGSPVVGNANLVVNGTITASNIPAGQLSLSGSLPPARASFPGIMTITGGNLSNAGEPEPAAPAPTSSNALRVTSLSLSVGGNTPSFAGTTTVAGGNLSSASAPVRLIAPWYRTGTGREMVVFDVGDPESPRHAATLDVRIGRTGDWSKPLALDGKLYLSSMSYDEPSPDGSGRTVSGEAPRTFRHFLRTVDFADPANPVVSGEVNIPGRLLAVTHGGTTLLTTGCGFDAIGDPAGFRAFHTSHFDGTAATLVDQLRMSSAPNPHAVDGGNLFTGSWATPDGRIPRLRAWRIADDRTLGLAGEVEASNFSRLATVNGLLVGFGDGLPQVFDFTDPANPRRLDGADTRGLTSPELGKADGRPGRGIWQPQGDSGVGVVRLAE